ncbi:MAG: class I SAM-dependent methyltransferase [Pseudomonadota bacterium]
MQASTVVVPQDVSGAYAEKDTAYFSGARTDFVSCLPADGGSRVLEVGCGTGATGAYALAQGRASYYAGVELFPSAAVEAEAVLSDVIVGDVETLQFDWQPANFDALFLSEVMEHLREPAAVLEKLNRYLRPGALVLASSPNISHWRVIRELAKGRFPQEDRGVFDRTHLRWFTPESYCALFERAGFVVEWAGPVTPPSWRTRLISRLTGGALDHLFMTQVCLIARKRG